MTVVVVSGVPNVKLNKIIFVLKATFKKNFVSDAFWIEKFIDEHGSRFKKMIIVFESYEEACTAQRFLDGFIYRLGGAEYRFSARVGDERRQRTPPSFRRGRSPERYERYDRRGRSRSRSPIFQSDPYELDMEIELLRKQRLVIEEERRLLLERKKLELVREFGPNAVKEFAYLEDRDREYMRPYEHERRRSMDRYRRRSIDREPIRRRVRGNSPPRPRRDLNPRHKGLPLFVLPCKLLIESMKQLITACTTDKKESQILEKLIRNDLRKRIAIALEGKERLSTAAIIKLYRKLHPVETDDDLVKSLAKNIKDSHLPHLTSRKGDKDKSKKEKDEDKAKSAEDNKTEKKETTEVEKKENNDEEKTVEETDAVKTIDLDDGVILLETSCSEGKLETANLTEKADVETVEIATEDMVAEEVEQENNESTVSIDATETKLAVDNVTDWVEGGTDWNEVQGVQGNDEEKK